MPHVCDLHRVGSFDSVAAWEIARGAFRKRLSREPGAAIRELQAVLRGVCCGHEHLKAFVLVELAHCHRDRGDVSLGLRCLEQVATLGGSFEERSDAQSYRARTWLDVFLLNVARGEFLEAARTTNPIARSHAIVGLAACRLQTGERAVDAELEAAREALREVSAWDPERERAELRIAAVAAEARKSRADLACLLSSEEGHRFRSVRLDATEALFRLALARGDYDEAAEVATAAVSTFRDMPIARGRALVHLARAQAASRDARLDETVRRIYECCPVSECTMVALLEAEPALGVSLSAEVAAISPGIHPAIYSELRRTYGRRA
jgi:tetratricopeptide (TPR) repeat protein